MHATSEALPRNVSEADSFAVRMVPSMVVGAPRVATVPVAFECRTERMLEIGNEPHVVVIGEVVWMHVDADMIDEGRIDQGKLDPVGRIGGPEYTSLGPRHHRPAR